MLGLTNLSHIAFQAEEAMDDITEGRRKLDPPTAALLSRTIVQIEVFLEGAVAGTIQEKALLDEVTRSFRRWKGLPEAPPEPEPDSVPDTVAGSDPAVEAAESEPAPMSPLLEREAEVAAEPVDEEFLTSFWPEAQDHLGAIERLLAVGGVLGFRPSPCRACGAAFTR